MEAIIISGSWILVVILIVALLDLNKRVHELEEKVKAIVEPCKNLLGMWEEVTTDNIEKWRERNEANNKEENAHAKTGSRV